MTSGKLQFSIEVWVSPSSLLLWRYWLDNSYHTMSLPSTQNTPAQQLSIIELFHIHSVLATWQSLSNLAPSLQESPVQPDQIRADGKLSLSGVYCPPWPSFQAFVRFYPCSRSPQFLDNPVKPVRHYRSYTPSPSPFKPIHALTTTNTTILVNPRTLKCQKLSLLLQVGLFEP